MTPTSAPPASLERWAFAAAALSTFSGVLYVAAPEQIGGLVALCAQSVTQMMVLPGDFGRQVVMTTFFLLASTWQWLFAILLVAYRQRLSHELVWAGLGWAGLLVGVWAVLRVWGIVSGAAQPLNGLDLFAQVVQVSTLACLVVLWVERGPEARHKVRA
jgi:hypothetical protein